MGALRKMYPQLEMCPEEASLVTFLTVFVQSLKGTTLHTFTRAVGMLGSTWPRAWSSCSV